MAPRKTDEGFYKTEKPFASRSLKIILKPSLAMGGLKPHVSKEGNLRARL